MATIPQIAMGFRQPEIASPLNMMAQVSQLQALQEANSLRQAQTAKIEREAARENQLAQLLSTGQPLTLQQLARFPGGAKIYEEQQQALQKEQAAREDRMGKFAQALHNIRTDPSLDTFSRTWQYLKENNLGEGLEQTASQMMLMSPEERLNAVRRFIDATPGMPLYVAKLEEERAKALKTGAEARKTVAGARIEEARLGGMQGGMTAKEREDLIPASIREAKWFQNATPEEKAAYTASQAVKRQQINIDQRQESALVTALGDKQAETISKGREGALSAASNLDTINTGRQLLKEGVLTGTGAEFLVNLNQALKTIGIDSGFADASANSQAFTANMGASVGQLIKQFGAGTGLSNADREYAEKMAGGKITLDEKAIRRILDINERASRNVIQAHNKSVEKAGKAAEWFKVEEPTFAPVDLPPLPAPPRSTTPRVRGAAAGGAPQSPAPAAGGVKFLGFEE